MNNSRKLLKTTTQERVKELFDYHIDGYLVNKIDHYKSKKGFRAGGISKSRGYHRIHVDGVLYRLNRIIWLWHHGYLPEKDIDHEDRNKSNDRIENLREFSRSCNMLNTGPRSTNKSGVSGVNWNETRKSWSARLMINGKSLLYKHFPNFNDAVLARWNKEVEVGLQNCNSTSSSFLYLKENNLL